MAMNGTETTTTVRPFNPAGRIVKAPTYTVRDPLTGEPRYFRNEEAALCYAARSEIALAECDL
jgi:hypothetical protein